MTPCPECGDNRTPVYDSRPPFRRRRCKACGYAFRTQFEVVEKVVQKKNTTSPSSVGRQSHS